MADVNKLVKEERINEILNNSKIDVKTIFDTCTIVSVQLPNGFVLVEASGAVSKENYSEEIGAEICYSKIVDTLWKMEGYLLSEKIYNEEKK